MMIKHYLKVAFRNLAKYKVQSIVSILGLAVGFVCFALSTLWIRYEMTYDTFHEGAERIYLVRAHYAHEPGKISNSTPYPLADYLQKGNPEIEAMASTSVQKVKFRVKDTEKDVVSAAADSVLLALLLPHAAIDKTMAPARTVASNLFFIMKTSLFYPFMKGPLNNIIQNHRRNDDKNHNCRQCIDIRRYTCLVHRKDQDRQCGLFGTCQHITHNNIIK